MLRLFLFDRAQRHSDNAPPNAYTFHRQTYDDSHGQNAAA